MHTIQVQPPLTLRPIPIRINNIAAAGPRWCLYTRASTAKPSGRRRARNRKRRRSLGSRDRRFRRQRLRELDRYRSLQINNKAGAATRNANELVNRGRRKQQFKQIAASVASSHDDAVPIRRVTARFENLGVDGILARICRENRSENDLGLRSSHKRSEERSCRER